MFSLAAAIPCEERRFVRVLVRSPDLRRRVAITTQASGYTTATAHTVRGSSPADQSSEHFNYRLRPEENNPRKRAESGE